MSPRRPAAPLTRPAAPALRSARSAGGSRARPVTAGAPGAASRRPAPAARARSGGARPPRRRPGARTVLLTVVAIIALASVIGPARAYLHQRAEINALRADLASRQADADRLRRQVRLWDDPAYVQAQARSRLHVVMPGETGYVLVGPTRASSTDAARATSTATSTAASRLASAGTRLSGPLASASARSTPSVASSTQVGQGDQ